jgi:hypothetical protein
VIGTITFRNTPVILQYEDTPLLEVVKTVEAGFDTQFYVFDENSKRLGKVLGSRFVGINEDDEKRVRSREFPDMTVVELDGKTILELRRHGAQALKGWAELFAPGGVLVKANDAEAAALLKGQTLAAQKWLGTSTITGNIGIHYRKNGIAVGAGGGSVSISNLRLP